MSAKKKSEESVKDEMTGNAEDSLENGSEESIEGSDLAEMESTEGMEKGAASDLASQMVEVDAEHLARLETEAKENYDKYLRAVAEFENYKKRMIRERADLLKYAGESVARDLLEVLDDLERAVNAASAVPTDGGAAPTNPADFIAGVKLIKDRFVSIFDKHGIKGESAVGQPFDPNTHQALASVPVAEVDPNIILDEFKKAYFYKDKLLRVGQVVVSAAPPAASPPEGEST